MKRLFILGFSAALLAGGVSSCAKTSKGKMANEWKVSEINSKDVSTNSSGSSTFELILNDTKVTINNTGTDGEKTVSEGTVQDVSYTIGKDGTWSSVFNVTLVTSQTTNNVTITSTDVITNTASGTWNFLGNVEEFKKNERVVFNTLEENSKTVNTLTIPSFPDEVSTTTQTNKFANGESPKVYLVVESKKKELQLSYEEDYSSTETEDSSSDTWANKLTESMTLVQK